MLKRVAVLFSLLGLGLWLAIGCNQKPPTPAPVFAVNVSTIGPAGGFLVGDDAGVPGARIDIPAGALGQDTPVAMGPDPAPPPAPTGLVAAGPAVLFSPEGLVFNRPATIIIPYTGPSDVALFTAPAVAGEPWVYLDGGTIIIDKQVYQVPVKHFSRYQLFRPPTP
jgi:hypothetical protein